MAGFAVHDEVDKHVVGRPAESHELAHFQAYHGIERLVAIVDEGPVFVVEALVATTEHIGLLLQFYFVAFLTVIESTGVATNLDGDATDILFVVARIEKYVVLYFEHRTPMHFVFIGGAYAECSRRRIDEVAGWLFVVDGVDAECVEL